jgi:phosphoribosylanthranilate isomerase
MGFVCVEQSPRRAPSDLLVSDAASDTCLTVAVTVGEDDARGADLVQRYAVEEAKVRGRDAVLLRDGEEVARVVDLPWQENDPTHFDRARAVEGRLMLAGGLGPENVRAAIDAVAPWAVDASSSLESAPGIKDHDRVRAYVEAAR